ncbi:acetyl esterase/lipase [Rhizobium rhizoryzae]|uniref:Acetyl esterase/lipase n=3 Tax=Rhizobium rhizoryzae TaxID=451876 RepID=A0A7W6LF46_9HYPH|nr:acetyl esterase/lipase [Rhizobium rhizoryzae]
MPPEFPFPAALDDCMCVYKHAVDTHGAERIVIGGRSAGGNLALATVVRAQDEGLDLPRAIVLLSPEIDLTESGDSFQTNKMIDVNLPTSLMPANLLYANGADLAHPYISPLFGRFNTGCAGVASHPRTSSAFETMAGKGSSGCGRLWPK